MSPKSEVKDGGLAVAQDSIFTHHSERAVWDHRQTYGPSGFKGVFMNSYVTFCAIFAAIGGLLFGYDLNFDILKDQNLRSYSF